MSHVVKYSHETISIIMQNFSSYKTCVYTSLAPGGRYNNFIALYIDYN